MAPVLNFLTAVLSVSLLVGSCVAAPVPGQGLVARQLAGEGAACNSVLSSTDNGVGYGVEDAEDNTAGTLTTTKGAGTRRQLAGEGAACDSVLSSTDNGVGYGVENAEDNTAGTLTTAKGSAPAGRVRRQADKISDGTATLLDAAGLPGPAGLVKSDGDTTDSDLTNDAATDGAQVGNIEDITLEGAGSQVPKL